MEKVGRSMKVGGERGERTDLVWCQFTMVAGGMLVLP